jgi:GTPase SAR1 family protein
MSGKALRRIAEAKRTKAKSLDLSFTKVSDASALAQLSQLKTLFLVGTPVIDVSALAQLRQLQTLYLDGTAIRDVSALAQLSQLKTLFLNRTEVNDVSALAQLSQLQTLNLRDTHISDVSALAQLSQLQTLDLNRTKVSDVSDLGQLSELKTLNLDETPISDVSALAQLSQLQTLDLNRTKVSDVSALAQLSQLQTLDLSHTGLSDLRPLLQLIESGLKVKIKEDFRRDGIYVANTPLTSPPIEIVQQGNKAVIEYFEQLDKQGVDYLYEAKMLIVGEGGAGKTSLVRKLEDQKNELPEEEETTKGIDIHSYTFDCGKDREFSINMWDFGGQEIYHATHQFFLSKDALYVLVDSTRVNAKKADDGSFQYWLQSVELLGGGSPLLIVQNEIGDRSKDLDMLDIQGRFGFVKEKYPMNLQTCRGLDEFETDLKHYIQKLPHVGQALPKRWIPIREELIELSMK